jgi:hypothetical protein
VLGRVVELQFLGQPLRYGWREGRVERVGRMGIDLVQDEGDLRGCRVENIDHLVDVTGAVEPGPLVTEQDGPAAAQRLGRQEEVGHPAPDVLGVGAGGPTGRQGLRRPGVGEPLAAGSIEADDGAGRVEGALLDGEQVLPAPHTLQVGGRGKAPLLAQVRLAVVSVSVWRTVSGELAATTSRRTSSSASWRRLRRVWPSGAYRT